MALKYPMRRLGFANALSVGRTVDTSPTVRWIWNEDWPAVAGKTYVLTADGELVGTNKLKG